MGLISFTPTVDGTTNAAATVNTPLSTIYNDYNGNITDANIAANAAISGSKIGYSTISNPYKFSVYRNASFASSTTAAKLQFDSKTFDTGTNYDATTNYRFTAPIAGFYYFNACISTQQNSGSGYAALLYKNGTVIKNGMSIIATQTTSFALACLVSGLLQLAAGDYVEVWQLGNSSTGGVPSAASTYFEGFLVSAT